AGVYPSPVQVANAPQTRAQIATDYLPFFYTTGFCGTSPGNATTLWFHNADTNHDGTLVNPIHWSWDKPYGKFFAVAVVSSPEDPKIKPTLLFDKNTKPYINFEVKPNVFQQGDLMTACTDEVHYEKRFAAPIIPLKFRHALTAVRFKVGQNLSWNKTITKVEIIGAKSKGCYTLSTQVNGTGTWSVNPQDKGKTFTLDDVNVSTSAAVNHIIVGDNDNYTFYMIPQQLDGVSVKITFSDKSTISANLSGEWKAGTTKTYALSEKNSNWGYVLTVPPASVNTTTDIGYLVESYRRTHGGYVQYPVPWKVVNYQEIIDGIEGPITTEKPDWLTSLTMEGGKGSNIFEIHQATLQRVPAINKLAVYNKELQEAEERGTENDPYDLSMHNLEGKKTLRNTANCYLISAPGWYKIPLVYGNGVKNGKENLHSYQTMNTGGKFVLKRFTDHDNDVISTPYINCQSPTNFAEQADVVWTDQPGIVDN
ncbi:hypothetical protein HMPREF3034_01889, partial [Prevotella sp. DNF00663]|uniref:fimbrillin family protein n=1 Tax=Prevotella sp. DNF00663 TaxID=1384078 RepID=UPI00079993B9